MAATDKVYRSQHGLDIVFGVTCLLMLGSIVWMFAQDYYREFKVEQRDFRDVEEAVNARRVLHYVPDPEKREAIASTEKEVADARQERDIQADQIQRQLKKQQIDKVRKENEAQALKADFDSKMSIYNIEVENRNAQAAGSAAYQRLDRRVQEVDREVQSLRQRLTAKQAEVEAVSHEVATAQAALKDNDRRVTDAEKKLKEMTEDFERFAKAAAQKRWKTGDAFRALPVLDAFNSPTRIQQFTLDQLPIDYNFKHVTRYDRCMTCHQGIDKTSDFTKADLSALTVEPSDDLKERLKTARDMLRDRAAKLNDPKAADAAKELRLDTLSHKELSPARINEYCSHPRLDLFVDGNSPHPAEKFGCTVCHSGQGSATDFNLASHTPNDAAEKERWMHQADWESNHFWDFPMLPKRFVESSCIKCHHQVTDLLPDGDKGDIRPELAFKEGKAEITSPQRADAPGVKVVRGYNLVRELGCFGCHEITGIKGGRSVGPDLRLEPSPALDMLTAEERVKLSADPLNPPGTMRKVGPSLRRLAEKTNAEWVRHWIRAPRDFRPDTRMPHFYGLSNNHPDVLPEEQKKFPDAEINAITYYLFRESKDYLAGKDTYYRFSQAKEAELKDLVSKNLASEDQRKELVEVQRRLELSKPAVPISKEIRDGEDRIVQLPPVAQDAKAQVKLGRQLFTEKGCLACHSHAGTAERMEDIPAVVGEANFGPDLSRIAAKIKPEEGDADARRRWLVQWILNPSIHHPRTRMPVTHLNENQAAAIAAWLLNQPAEWTPPPVAEAATVTLETMARIYLEKALGGRRDAEDVVQNKGIAPEQEAELRKSRPDADELRLAPSRAEESWDNKLKWYVGKKAITALGCFGCHDVPGFEFAKPIGTPLNDWGKKDPERIAFEDVIAYVKKNYYPVEQQTDAEGHGHAAKEEDGKSKPAYERFFLDALEHHQREGFLNQKLREPRSYDYERIRSWEDRLRMPQFRFGRKVKPLEGETAEQAEVREDAEAREALMTFILGLVAEPIPLKFVNDPAGDKLAVAKGKHVLEKFNCAGCHELQAGIYEFSTRAGSGVVGRLQEKYTQFRGDLSAQTDLPFPEHNAWAGRTPPADRVIVHGLGGPTGDDDFRVKLTEALRFVKRPTDEGDLAPGTYDLPAAETIALPTKDLIVRADPHGGTLADLLVPYLVERKPSPSLDDKDKARSGLPPPLLREGEKTQPGWLFRFLKHPTPIRPQLAQDANGTPIGVMLLRMPRFNMSDDEAMSLVNYFAAVDRLSNPGIGLSYPYERIPQQEEDYLRKENQPYVRRIEAKGPTALAKHAEDEKLLTMVWDRLYKQHVAELEEEIKSAQKTVDLAKGTEKATVQKRIDSLSADLKKLSAESGKKDGPYREELRRHWEQDSAYTVDAYRLLANNNLCLKCHEVGKNPPSQPIGPPLTLTPERLRPDWTRRWIAQPQRLLIYPTGLHPMPQNFPANKADYTEIFAGTPREQVTAVRDVLMNYPKAADLPENRYYEAGAEGGK